MYVEDVYNPSSTVTSRTHFCIYAPMKMVHSVLCHCCSCRSVRTCQFCLWPWYYYSI